MTHRTPLLLVASLSLFSCMLLASTPEVQKAIALYQNGQREEAYQILRKYKDSDDADALAYLGWYYITEEEGDSAFAYGSRAAGMGNSYGLALTGLCYAYGSGVKQDIQKAEQCLLQAVEAGSCDVDHYVLGLIYEGKLELNEGTPTIADFGNHAKALEHFMAAYNGGFSKADCAVHIGSLLLESDTPQEGIRWLSEASDLGSQWATGALAFRYESGLGVQTDRNVALNYAERLGESWEDWEPYRDISYRTGLEYLVRNQRREAMLFLQMAADKGHADAQYYIAMLHPDDAICGKYAVMAAGNGYRQLLTLAGKHLAQQGKYDEARKFYLEAVKDGDLEAMCELAVMCRDGEGFSADYDKAMGWYEKAAGQYYPCALRELGVKYSHQYDMDPQKDTYETIPPTLSKAYVLMAMAAFMGDDVARQEKLPGLPFFDEIREMDPADSDMELAKGIIRIGYGDGEADTNEGVKLMETAVSHENVYAMVMLGWWYSSAGEGGDGSPDSLKKAAEFYTMAALKGSDFAEKQLCRYDLRKSIDEEEAIRWLKKQADKGYEVALYNLARIYEKNGDVQTAEELHLRNARSGNGMSVDYLIRRHMLDGQALPCDDEEMDQLVEQALKGHAGVLAYTQSAICSLKGDPTVDNAMFVMRAYLDGCEDAYEDLASIYLGLLEGTGVLRLPDFAVELLEEAIAEGKWNLCLELGIMLVTGEHGVRQNYSRAKELFRLGFEHGVEGCLERLERMEDVEKEIGNAKEVKEGKEKKAESAPAP